MLLDTIHSIWYDDPNNVFFKVVHLCIAFVTILTLIPFFYSMNFNVICENTFLDETLLAMFTSIGFLIGVLPHYMQSEAIVMYKTLPAMLTLKWFLFGVSSDMILEVLHLCKAFLAMLALIRFLFGVSSQMIFESTFNRKTFLAISTLVWSVICVNYHVPPQSTLICKTSLALITLIWFLICGVHS